MSETVPTLPAGALIRLTPSLRGVAMAMERLRVLLAQAFDVPLFLLDPDRLEAEARLRETELARWADDGGPA